MYRVILLTLGLVLIVAGDSLEQQRKCGKVMHQSMQCCKNNNLEWSDLKDCFKLPLKPHSCDFEICVGLKLGFGLSDGTINKEKYTQYLEQNFENNTDFVDAVKKNCVDGDISKYGEEDFCDLLKLQICSSMQFVKNCNDWKDDGECQGVKELALECVKQKE